MVVVGGEVFDPQGEQKQAGLMEGSGEYPIS
jgi:hypothetical protein